MASRPQRRRRVKNDLNAEFRYHAGGALFIPQQTSPEQVLSVAMPPEQVSSAATALSLPDPILSEHVAANDDDGSVAQESHQSSVKNEENNPSSSPESNSDTSEKLNETDVEYQSSESEEESEDDSSVYSSEYDNDDSEPLANKMRKPKRKHQEDQSQKGKCSDGVTRPTKRSKNRRKQDIEKWNQRLKGLKIFKAKHGHCRVPKSSSSLYNWLRDQRSKFLNPSHSSYLQDISERERRMKEVESVLGTKLGDWTSQQRTTEAIKWDARLEEFKAFKAKNGHCRVPKSSGSLYIWLIDQRQRRLNPNSPKYLKDIHESERRTKELEFILGAKLGDLTNQQRTMEAIRWDARLEELKELKAKHGHCSVPKSSRALYEWLQRQRNVILKPGHTRYLQDVPERERRTKELESLLGTKVGDWTNQQRTLDTMKWDARLEELKATKTKHGHCRVPKSSGALNKWLWDQRSRSLNPNSPKHLQDVPERERRTKELESVLGESLLGSQVQIKACRTTRTPAGGSIQRRASVRGVCCDWD